MTGRSWCRQCEAFTCVKDRNGVRRCPDHGVREDHGEVGVTLERHPDGPYLRASIDAVHNHGCAASRQGQKHGPCDCGGQGLMDRFLAANADDPWGAIARHTAETPEGGSDA